SLNDMRQILDRNLFSSAITYSWNRYDFVRTCFFRDGLSEFGLQLLRLLWQHHQALFDVVRNNISSEGNNRSVTDDIVVENSDVGCSSTNIDQANTRLLLFVTEDLQTRGKRLKDQVIDLKTRLANTFVHIIEGIRLRSDKMEISFQANS